MPYNTLPQFERLEAVNFEVVRDFVPLLQQLSPNTFAKLNEEDQLLLTGINLSTALENPDETAVFVHRDDDNRIIATATANLAYDPNTYGWVDDVVTLDAARGRGLGRGAMVALHKWLAQETDTVKLTSSYEREAAGNLYEDMGYVLGGQVWRANLAPYTGEEVETDEDADTTSGGRTEITKRNDEDQLTAGVWINDCDIPTGHKAWIDGLFAGKYDLATMASLLEKAQEFLARRGTRSANVITDQTTHPNLTFTLARYGYEPRPTRLYTLELDPRYEQRYL